MTQVPILGRVDEEAFFDKNVVKKYAEEFLHAEEFRNYFEL